MNEDYIWTVGMAVALKDGYGAAPRKRTIARVTPSGIGVIASGGAERMFKQNGYERAAKSGYWGRPKIAPWTAEHDTELATARAEHLAVVMGPAMADLDGYAIDEIRMAAETIRAARIASKAASNADKAAATAANSK